MFSWLSNGDFWQTTTYKYAINWVKSCWDRWQVCFFNIPFLSVRPVVLLFMMPFVGKFVSFFWWILQLCYWTFGWTEQCFCCCRLQDVWCWADGWDKQLGVWCLRRYCWLWGCSCWCSQQLALRQDLDHRDLRQRHWPFWTYHRHFAGGWHRLMTIAKFINWNTLAFFKSQDCLSETSSST